MATRGSEEGAAGASARQRLDPPGSRAAFWHVEDVVPTQHVAGAAQPRMFDLAAGSIDVGGVGVTRVDGSEALVSSILAETFTDACVVVQDGAVVFEQYREQGDATRSHALMSLTKPVVGCVVAALAERGPVDPDEQVTHYVPELEGSGYAGARVRDLLDMRSGVLFREEYTNPDSEISELDRWVSASQYGGPDAERGLYAYLATVGADTQHGGMFHSRSADTDVLGWVCERAAGRPMAELMSEFVWAPMGARHDGVLVCDGNGTAIHDGGLNATALDVARFAQVLADGGVAPDGNGGQRVVVPQRWLRHAWAVDADARNAFAGSSAEMMLPGGWFRNQLWFRPGPHGDVLVCLGIFGQLVHVCRRTRTVCVKLSSWPEPQHPAHLQDTIRAFDAVGGALSRSSPKDPKQRLPGVVSGV